MINIRSIHRPNDEYSTKSLAQHSQNSDTDMSVTHDAGVSKRLTHDAGVSNHLTHDADVSKHLTHEAGVSKRQTHDAGMAERLRNHAGASKSLPNEIDANNCDECVRKHFWMDGSVLNNCFTNAEENG